MPVHPKSRSTLSSDSVEEYLEAIYAFNEKGELAKNTELAKRLKVAPPSVTQMIQRLAEEGLVEYQPYKGATLTGRGMALAQNVVRKHRLLERFLHDTLGMNKEKVHNEACRMEHSVSDEVALALCDALDSPETCPDDGSTIPPCPMEVDDCEECAILRESETPRLLTELSNLKPGERGRIAFIRAGRKASQRLLDMGFTKGAEVQVVNAAPFKGPLEISVRGSSLALGRGLASKVFVEILNGLLKPEHVHPHGPHH
ncbi:MAG: metal-dependent transcriptional regulator [Candidatus Bathyarchaeota archaeon]|nr:MAG: metal-dependent transcriptional regulator [Candidatus Bathyarchaeota archaeon]